MILLDTNVVSELMRVRPLEPVALFFRINAIQTLFLPAVVLAELRYGMERLAPSRRRSDMAAMIDGFEFEGFAGRILSFDAAAAGHYGRIVAERDRRGRPIQVIDAQIAAIARAHGLTVATRNTRDFAETGIDLVDPFAL